MKENIIELVIVGAGGMGREVFSWLSYEIKGKENIKIKGFLDDNPDALAGFHYPNKIIGKISEYEPLKNERVVLSILDPKTKRRIAEYLMTRGAEFYTLIHPTAIIGTNIKMGKGIIICPNCILTNDITIGDFVFINTNSTIGHDAIIGDYTSINGKVEITGRVKVGNGCLFGVGAKVIPGRVINDGAKIGAGSIVIRNVQRDVTVFGNPAKRI